jgi:hypothetical protein
MNLRLLMLFSVLMSLALMQTACGLKTGLVVYDDSAPLPELVSVSHTLSEHQLSLNIDMQGGSGAVAYQIDRAVIENNCKCIGNWLRYYESSASVKRKGLIRNIKRYAHTSYAFRLRAIDQLGRKSAWSDTIKVLAQAKESKIIESESHHE